MLKESDIIKYISFFYKKGNIKYVIKLPFSCEELTEYKRYNFNILGEKYLDTLLKIGKKHTTYSCSIRTIFGDDYRGYWGWSFYEEDNNKKATKAIIFVESCEIMKYENYYLRSLNSNKRFQLMDIR